MSHAGVAKLVDARDLSNNLSAHRETGEVELPKFGEAFTGNPEPSPFNTQKNVCNEGEGVETRRAAPKAHRRTAAREGEGIVQTPNGAKAETRRREGGESRSRYENPSGR